MARCILGPDDFQMSRPMAAADRQTVANLRGARQPPKAAQALWRRQEPPCFVGSEMVSRLRPFFRRRESTSRPHRVAIRARKPCLLIRRRLRGRYEGFIAFSSLQ